MDYEKIGKFILLLRKEQGLTQSQLAEKLDVTNIAISKWERGLGAPDISLLRNLSSILKVSINEILIGEKLESITKEQSDEILVESIFLYQEKGIKKTISISLIIFMFTFFVASLVIFNVSMILSRFYLYVVFSILGCLFISLLFSIKLLNSKQTKKILILIACIIYTVSLISYTLYSGISYNLNNIKFNGFNFNLIPFKTILTSFKLVITQVQPPTLLFDYVIIDLFLFVPCSLFVPYLFDKKFNLKKFLFTFLLITILKEFLQLITGYGIFNIDDIILNLLGIIIMFYFFKKFKFIIN